VSTRLEIKMEVIKDFRNELLKRKEVKMVVQNSGNPGFGDAKKVIAKKFKVVEENIAMKNVKGKFGRDTFLLDAFVYDTKEDLDRVEPVKKEKKGGSR
jgi:ribosomal protein S24E